MNISTTNSGFYRGFNVSVAAIPKVIILAFILWVGLSPERAGQQLASLQTWSTSSFGAWYIYVTAFFTLTCIVIAIWPKTGKIVLGAADAKPEFSMFTWLSMMFGAGIGIGMLTYSTAEPIFHFANNPETIQGVEYVFRRI
jgi:choline-glycine betaine transporter